MMMMMMIVVVMVVKVIPSGLDMELGALYIPGEHSTSELHSQPHSDTF